MSATEGISQVSALATHTALSAWAVASDFLIIIILVTVFFLFAWYVGRGPLVAVMLAFYSAYALYVSFPYLSFLPTAPPLTALLSQAGLYAVITFAFYIILRRVVVSDFLYVGVFGLIALSFLGAAFLLALAYHVFPVCPDLLAGPTCIYHFTPAIDALFAPTRFFWWWFIAPAIGLFFLAR